MNAEQCAECGSTYRSQVAWRGELTAEMVKDLTSLQVASLIDCLDTAVEIVASDFGIGQ